MERFHYEVEQHKIRCGDRIDYLFLSYLLLVGSGFSSSDCAFPNVVTSCIVAINIYGRYRIKLIQVLLGALQSTEEAVAIERIQNKFIL